MDKEFLQFIKETGYDDLLDMNEKNIVKFKNTFFYKNWQLWKALRELGNEMLKTKLGSLLISIAKFLDKCFNKIS